MHCYSKIETVRTSWDGIIAMPYEMLMLEIVVAVT